MKESQFQREVINTFHEYGWDCIKLPDMPRNGVACVKCPHNKTRFIPKKPFDLIALSKTGSIVIECKIKKTIGRINKTFFASKGDDKKGDILDYHQVKELKKRKDLYKIPAFYFLNIRLHRKLNALIIIEIDEFIAMFEHKDYISKEALEGMIELAIPGKRGLYKSELFSVFLQFIKKYT